MADLWDVIWDELDIPKRYRKKARTYSRYVGQSLALQASLRGKYLLRCAQLEYVVDEVIAHHFCRNRENHDMLRSLVLLRMPFSAKVIVLKKVLNTYNNPVIRKSMELVPSLTRILEFRNKIAHSSPQVDSNYFRKPLDQPIRFRTYTNRKKVLTEVSKEEFAKKLDEVFIAVQTFAIIDMHVEFTNGMKPLTTKKEARDKTIEHIKGYY